MDKPKRGTIREDGKLFWSRELRRETYVDVWLSREAFDNKKKKQRRSIDKWASKNVEKRREYSRKSMQNAWINNPKLKMLSAAKHRALKEKFVPFSITVDDFDIPDVCPILGIPMFRGESVPCENSPSLDRVVPSLGYVPGNVWVISKRANAIKRDATLQELQKLVDALSAFLKA